MPSLLMSTSLLSLPVTSLQTSVSVVLVPELLVSGLEVFKDSCELLSDDVSAVLSVPLVLVLSARFIHTVCMRRIR